jgi:hypothetical protein
MDGLGNDTADTFGTTVDDLAAIGRLLHSPRLAHIWFTLHVEGSIAAEAGDNPFLWDGFTVSELEDLIPTDIPQSTLYNDISELVEVGAIRIESESQPKGYGAVFFQAEAENIDGIDQGHIIGPETIGLIGEAHRDDGVQGFLNDYSHSMLKDALEAYIAVITGRLDRDFTTVFPDVPDEDLEAITPAIERVLAEVSREPLFKIDYRPDLSESPAADS